MLKNIVSYFIKYHVIVNLTLFVMILVGFLGFSNLRFGLFPPEDVKYINIGVRYPGASPIEVEEGITNKIEEELKGITGIKRVTSSSEENYASIKIELTSNATADVVLDDVKTAVESINSFPDNIESPVIEKEEILNLAVTIGISSSEIPLTVLKDIAEDIKDDFLAEKGISKVFLLGLPDEEIEVSVRESDLKKYKLSIADINRAIAQSNIKSSGGTIKSSKEDILIRASAKEYYAAGLSDLIILANPDGQVVRLKDVAAVKNQFADVPNDRFINGERGVIINVFATNDEDILQVADFSKNYIQTFNAENTRVAATLVNDLTIGLSQQLKTLTASGWQGILLVLLMLSIFLNWRVAMWVALGIPVSLIAMFFLMNVFGVTINILSVFGCILVLGILVDDGVVVAENIYQHSQKGKSIYQAAVDGTIEVLPSVLSSLLTTITVFSLFFFIDGRLGDYFSDLAFVIIVTLSVSIIECFLLLPAHLAHSKAIGKDRKEARYEKFINRLFLVIQNRIYRPFFKFATRLPWANFLIGISSLALTVALIASETVQSTFFPNIDRDNLTAEIKLPPSTNAAVTNAKLIEVEEAVYRVDQQLRKVRGVDEAVVLSTERMLGPGSNRGAVNVTLLEGETRGIKAFDIGELFRAEIGNIPEAEELTMFLVNAFGKPISISITHQNDDLEEIRLVKNRIISALKAEDRLKDITNNDEKGVKELSISLKPKAELLGLNILEVINQVRAGYFGSEVQSLQRGTEEVKVWVRYSETARSTIDQLEDVEIRTRIGQKFPLSEIANLKMEEGVKAINHSDSRRQMLVEADISALDVSVPKLQGDLKEKLLEPLTKEFPKINYKFEGQAEEAEKMQASVKVAGPLILIIMLSLVVITFRSFGQMGLVFFLTPFLLFGVTVGHMVHNTALSIFSGLGTFALIGVMINNALVLVSTFNQQLQEGLTFKDALQTASFSRFRPIVLTTITTVAGLFPLILSQGVGAQFLRPTSISIAYGLIFGMFLTLCFLPSLLVISNRANQLIYRLKRRKIPTPEQVEPAVRELEVHI
ncbi:MAG: efflux RND transporter permease subunit [Bacteroidota bacterium]